MGRGNSNGSSPVTHISFQSDTEKWETVFQALQSGMEREIFSKLFSLEWEGKCSILKSETVLFAFGLALKIGNNSPLLWFGYLELGNGSWISFQTWKTEIFSSRNSRLKTFSSENLGLEIFSSGNLESET
ncbi:hypothetical protein C1645_826426 [Glomus cerebriforme]|uniref:Uncharacterized protein n=1 Tax=Glomus cerebriforme TaxID=658196 RepID=A0A397SWH8_9GLOM|nr:hypothetical protein C1645_826426 [Glomus cerebriforme]